MGPALIPSPDRIEGSSDELGRLVIDESEQTEKSSKHRTISSTGLTVNELLKRKRKLEQITDSQKQFQIGNETSSLDNEKIELSVNHASQPIINILRKSRPSPKTKIQPEKTRYQIPKTRAQRKLYVQQIRDCQSGKQNTEESRLENDRPNESVVKEPNSVESEDTIEKDNHKDDDDDDCFPQGDTSDVISFTTDMYSDHDLSSRILPIESTVHEDIICGPDSIAKPGKNSVNKSEFLHRLLTQADQELEIIKIFEGDRNIQDDKSNEDSDSQSDSIDDGSMHTVAYSEAAASEASTPESNRRDKNNSNANGTDPKPDANPTTNQIRSELETKTGAQILYELSQRSFTRLVMGNNGQNSVENQGEIQSLNSAADKVNVAHEKVVPNENDTKETKSKRKVKSTKAVSHKKHESEVSFAQVGESAKIFLQKHPMLRGIYLNKGKREVKRNLIKLKRHQSAIDKGSYLRNGRVNDKNRIDDMFEYTEEGLKKKEEIDENNARDEYVVNWYMWCPGHGNCLRKCGGYGHCNQG